MNEISMNPAGSRTVLIDDRAKRLGNVTNGEFDSAPGEDLFPRISADICDRKLEPVGNPMLS